MSVISISDLSHVYRRGWNGRKSVRALNGVSFTVEEGEIFGLLGTNGAGKTTIVRSLLGVVFPRRGGISLLDRPPGDRRMKSLIGYLPEAYPYDRFLTGRAFLQMYGRMGGLSGRDLTSRIDQLAEELELRRDLHRSLGQYSRGMCQRLGLIQAMLHSPRLLILDEPTDGLDPVGRLALRTLFGRLRGQGTTVLLNSHFLSEVELICDRVAILHEGRIVRSGRVKDLTAGRGMTAIRIDAEEALTIRGMVPDLSFHDSGRTSEILLNTPEEVNLMLDVLRRYGIRILEVQPRVPTLEEVFLKSLGSPSGKEVQA
jgi:ABC-2 type transport system ATP-binding protein